MKPREVLGLGYDASSDDIRHAFRQAALEIHPDHSDSPEAAEAFIRLKQARDELLKNAELAKPDHARSVVRETEDARQAASAAVAASSATSDDDMVDYFADDDEITVEEIAHIQQLDQMAAAYTRRSPVARWREPEAVRRHRKQLETNLRRMSGRY